MSNVVELPNRGKITVIFFQQMGRAINIIDYYEERGQGLPHYIQMLQSKDYVYKDHFAPHDIEVTVEAKAPESIKPGVSITLKR